MAGGVSMVAASAGNQLGLCRNIFCVEKGRDHATPAALRSKMYLTRARVRVSTTTRTTTTTARGIETSVNAKYATWGCAVGATMGSGTRVRHLSSRGVIGGGPAVALRRRCFAVDKHWGRNARPHPAGSSQRRRAARIITRTRAIMEPATYAPSRGSLSFSEVFTTNIFAPG